MPEPAARAVLMLHGAGGGGWEWTVWARVFAAAGWRVDAPDLRAAPGGLAATRLDDYVRQALAALAALPRPRAVVGASLGGLLALACADAADAVVLVNPLLPAPWHEALPPRADAAVVPWRARASLAGTRAALPDASAADAVFAFRNWRDESGAVLAEARRGIAMPRPACPCRVVASTRDADVPIAALREFARAVDAAWQEVAGASHVGPLLGEGAASVAAEVLTWLNVKIASKKFSGV